MHNLPKKRAAMNFSQSAGNWTWPNLDVHHRNLDGAKLDVLISAASWEINGKSTDLCKIVLLSFSPSICSHCIMVFELYSQ